ncbi:MAG TPA: hypothetical protein VK550_15610, partial [Polyangiaceae bacterium]|nr:hypothetical protein [Polyangiaceae bacterium]
IEDGVITLEERARLDKAADAMGLDRQRLRKLEEALQAAYEARHNVRIRDMADEEPAPASIMLQPEMAHHPRVVALETKIAQLTARVAELERELETAREREAVEVDLSDMPAHASPAAEELPEELARRVRSDPRDVSSLRALFRAHTRAGEIDRRWLLASALTYLGSANDDEKAAYQQYRSEGLIKPASALGEQGWKLLFHPEEEVLTGQIFAVITPAVLLGRVSALRRDKALIKLDPARKQDPKVSTLQAVRCFAWAAAILGMGTPPLYADPEFAGSVEMVPGLPPATRLGKKALSGRSPFELAFLGGRHLCWYREEHFVRLLVPSAADLEDLFLAALSIANAGIPLSSEIKQRVTPIAKAIEPVLEPAAVDRVRGHFLRFLEDGGRTNLHRWATAAEKTSARAGLLLCNDLRAAHTVFELEDPRTVDAKMEDLLVFVTSDRYANIRKQIGLAVAAN